MRTYLVKSTPVLDANGVVGVMANPMKDDVWTVAMTFSADAALSLTRALSRGSHFRVVVLGFVEQDRFELVDENSRVALAGPHGALSTTDWVCSDHRAVLEMVTRNGVTAKARASLLESAFPPFRDARECHQERIFPR